jgi:hypothetical protein
MHFSRLSFNYAPHIFAKVSARCAFPFTCYHNVVNICEDISVHLVFENDFHHSTERGAGILEAFRHSKTTVGAEGCNEIHFLFIFHAQPNLMIAGEVV